LHLENEVLLPSIASLQLSVIEAHFSIGFDQGLFLGLELLDLLEVLFTELFADLFDLSLPDHSILVLDLLLQSFDFLHFALRELLHTDPELLVFPRKVTLVLVLNLLDLNCLLLL